MVQFCMSLLMQLVLYERPFDQEDEETYQLAKSVTRLVYDAMQKSDEWPGFGKNKVLKKLRILSYPLKSEEKTMTSTWTLKEKFYW